MAYLKDNEFSSYELTDEEVMLGSILTLPQRQVIQNEIALIASSKLSLVFNPNDVVSFSQQESFYLGQLTILKYRLECSDRAEEDLLFIDSNNEDNLEDPRLDPIEIFGE